MDLSAQANSKCTSDFSIERILSDDSKKEEVSPAPSWLCCTRYQPPRLPRTGSACRSRRSGRHARVPFTAAQAAALEAAYSRAPYLAPPALKALASALQLRDDRIKIWFQNRRARERREKSANIPSPQSGIVISPNQRPAINSSWLNQSDLRYNVTSEEMDQNCTKSNYISNLYESENSNESCDSPLNVDT
ncbi:unnamed protein product [Pieris macdunnoughi]|uniref:Homeobox domain-containing protein n=1 Tax=Pieris macdunnoughi TaxID=345717 RepID=A0A821VRF6_9NEOP|nr:unnamed protein product [Pieris macdunnoughi]